MIQKVLI